MTEIQLSEEEIARVARVGALALGEAFGQLAAQMDTFRKSMLVAGAYTGMLSSGPGRVAALTDATTSEDELEDLIRFGETLRNEARRRLSKLAAGRIGDNYPG